MCYLIAKHFNGIGCVAFRIPHGPPLVALKKKLISIIGLNTIELITISRPVAYLEYGPYSVVATEEEFVHAVIQLYESTREHTTSYRT